MRIETAYEGRATVVRLDGRLDAECSLQLSASLEELLRAGARTAVVDLEAVTYASSAGAAAITRSAREFAAVRGELFVTAPPEAVRLTLAAEGLDDQILETADSLDRGRISGALDIRGQQGHQTREWYTPTLPAATAGRYETVPRVAGGTLTCRVHGAPGRAPARANAAAGFTRVELGDRAFGLGIGAIGETTEQCAGPGELLAAGGVLFHLPTDGSGIPDYLATLGGRAPAAMLGDGLVCDGDFSHLVRFNATTGNPVSLSELATVCLAAAGGDAAGIVAVAETAGLVGAWRRPAGRPSAQQSTQSGARADTSSLREWLTLTAEPAYHGTTALVVGVVARRADSPLAEQLRPLRPAPELLGHVHAAIFPYRPVPQRTIDVRTLVAGLLEQQLGVRAIMHLLDDRRPGRGAGESTFLRGLAWTAPIGQLIGGEM